MSDVVGDTLRALEDGIRRSVVEALGEGSRSAGELAAALDVTPAVLTRHLRVLRRAGLVEVSLDPADHRRHVYELRPEPLRALRDWADSVAAFWADQLAAFAGHTERETAKSEERRRARR